MAKIDRQMVRLYKIKDDDKTREYSVVTGEAIGVASVEKATLEYRYSGDDIGTFTYFIKDLMIRSVKMGKVLPDRIVHGFG